MQNRQAVGRRSFALGAASLVGLAQGLTASPAFARGNDSERRSRNRQPLILAHRGASGYRPEHTLAAYELAIALGADYIEPDLVSTKDGVLVARHENEISGTTDVSVRAEFAGRRATKLIDNVSVTGWFTEDFTLAELRTLRAKERLPAVRPQNTAFDGQFLVPTLDEVITLAQRESERLCRTIGIYPETKHPSYFRSIGLPLEEPLVRTLRAHGYRSKRDPVFIQSFETANLKMLSEMTPLQLVQLVDAAGRPFDFALAGDTRTYADLVTPAGLDEIRTYADGVGANKNWIVPRDPATGRLLSPTSLIDDAHARGLLVHAWTFRVENQFLPANFRVGDPASPQFPNLRGDLQEELKLFFGLGLDGVFSDNPDIAVATRAGLPRCGN